MSVRVTKECKECYTYDRTQTNRYRCAVSGTCPGIERRQKIQNNKGCGLTLGHGEACVANYLCDACVMIKEQQKRISELTPDAADKVTTFEFKKDEEFKTADQIIDGMMHFELVGYTNKTDIGLVVLKDFSIGWLEED